MTYEDFTSEAWMLAQKKKYVESTPEVTAENILNREFHAEHFGKKWLTDVTEMKYGANGKACLSAIMDLADKSIVSFIIDHANNNALVFETFDIANESHPDVKSLFHSDWGYHISPNPSVKSLIRQE